MKISLKGRAYDFVKSFFFRQKHTKLTPVCQGKNVWCFLTFLEKGVVNGQHSDIWNSERELRANCGAAVLQSGKGKRGLRLEAEGKISKFKC